MRANVFFGKCLLYSDTDTGKSCYGNSGSADADQLYWCDPLIMDYHTHDYVTAAVSHLPHIISAGLVNLVHDSDSAEGVMKMIAAGGFQGYYPHLLFFTCDVAVDLYDQYRKHPYTALLI